MKYAIYEGNLDRLEKKLKRIFNKCKAYGCDFHYEQTGEEFRELKDEKGNKYTARFVLVEAEGTAVINDWEFVAELEHTEKGNIITGVAGIEVPERYYTTTPVCEHCNSKRYRKNTYIVRNKTTGEFKQVGKSCLKDFTHGMSAEAVTQYMSLFDTLIEGETPEPGCSYQRYVNTKEYLSYVAETIRHFGYTRTSDEGISTATRASEILMNIVEELQLDCKVLCTSRGKHFLFKNRTIARNRTHVQLAVGLTADIKVGSKLSYEVIKIDGEERFCEWDIEEGGKYQEVPKWLFPVKATADFVDMDAGDGRNQALFNYILTLTANDFTVEETRECIRILNKFVLKQPLSDDELEVILRDDAFQKPVFFLGSTFLFDKFAVFMKNTAHVIKINGQLHIYKDGVYSNGYKEIESNMIQHIPNLKKMQRREVLDYMELIVDEKEQSDANLMTNIRKKVENGQEMNYSEWCSINSYKGWLKHCDSSHLSDKYIVPIQQYADDYYTNHIKAKKKKKGGKKHERVRKSTQYKAA